MAWYAGFVSVTKVKGLLFIPRVLEVYQYDLNSNCNSESVPANNMTGASVTTALQQLQQ